MSITLIAQGPDENGEICSATLTASQKAFDRDPEQHKKIVRAWLIEDHPRIKAREVKVQVYRG